LRTPEERVFSCGMHLRGKRKKGSPLLLLALIPFAFNSPRADAAEGRKPNVLFIATDDLNAALGCMGDPIAKTPNIDRLARSGVLFNRAYCQQPLCNPSRASMLTGLRPDTLKVWDLATNFRTHRPRAVTLPQAFRTQGYFSARAGKIFHYGVPRQIGSGGMDDSNSWDWAINPRGRDKDEEDQLHVLTRGTGTTLGFAMAWREMGGTDAEQTDGMGVDDTIRVLERYGRQPLWMGMGFFRPHTPFVATKRWFDLYPKASFKLPLQPAGETDDIPAVALKINPANYGLKSSDLLDCVRGYYASVSFIDDQVGKLIAALERLQMIDHTIIVFFSDHGFLLGEHGQWQKEMLFEEAARVPLIIVPAGGLRREKSAERQWKCERVVELLDVYPTLVAMAGLNPPRPQRLQGRDLTPLLANPQAPWEHAALTQTPRNVKGAEIMGYSIRTERWRYTEWGNDGEHGRELYDHSNDAREFTNLARENRAEHQATIAALKTKMAHLKAVGRDAEGVDR
jgi:iduronate 2-sulfatase